MINDEGYILRSVNRHEHIGGNLHPASISSILKALQKDLKAPSDEQPLSGHSFRVGAVLDLLAQGEPLEKIMLRGEWLMDSTAVKYLRNGTSNYKSYVSLSSVTLTKCYISPTSFISQKKLLPNPLFKSFLSDSRCLQVTILLKVVPTNARNRYRPAPNPSLHKKL